MPKILIIPLVLCFSALAWTQNESGKQDGNKLLEYCGQAVKSEEPHTPAEHFGTAWCLGYIYGFVDGFDALAIASAKDETDYDRLRKSYVCYPKDVTAGQTARVLVKFLNDHPERLHQSASVLMLEAVQNAFPCRSEAPIQSAKPEK